MELKGNKYGTHRVIEPKGVLTQAAWKIDNDMTKHYSNEIICDVISLNIDSASFTQIEEACGGDEQKIGEMFMGNVVERGKQQNPVTGSGGMFKGVVAHIGEDLKKKPGFDLKEGDKIVSLVSLSMTPLKIDKLLAIHKDIARVDIVGKAILFEGQLGALRDLDYGSYPYTTSSSPLAGYGTVGAGVPASAIKDVYCVTKAYSSCVGAGPFTTALFGDEASELRNRGGDAGDYGATTGRPRRVGWFDAVATRYGCMAQGATECAMTNLDVLGYLDEIPVCVAYEVDGQQITEFPATPTLMRCKPVYVKLPGWKCDIRGVKSYDELPENCRKYVEFIENACGVPIKMVSNGPKRHEVLYR